MDFLWNAAIVIHVVSASIWSGSVILMTILLRPTAKSLGDDAEKFLQQLTRESKYGQVLSVLAWSTILSGLTLYLWKYGGLAPLTTFSSISLTIGAVAGVVALYLGVVLQKNTVMEIGKLSKQVQSQGTPPSQEQASRLKFLRERNISVGWWVTILLIIALVGMSLG